MTNNPYLWKKSGPKDSFIAKLEAFLGEKRIKVMQAGRRRRLRLLPIVLPVTLAAAAVVVAWVCLTPSSDKTVPNTNAPPVVSDTDQPAKGSSEPSPAPKQGAATKKNPVRQDMPVGETPLGQPGVEAPAPTDTEK